ncbi:MAG: hypothetical protein U0169_16490 [Polyangiaceae bacterium]
MLKVRIQDNLHDLKVGVAGASSLLVLGSGLGAGALGCASHGEGDTDVDTSSESAYSIANPGSAVLEFGWGPSYDKPYGLQVRSTTTDEFLRVGQKVSFSVSAYFVWNHLTNAGWPTDDKVKNAAVKIKALYLRDGSVIGSEEVASQAWTGTGLYDTTAKTGEVTIPKECDRVRFEATLSDTTDPAKLVNVASGQITEFPVLGAHSPIKNVLFDNNGNQKRDRVLEGGSPVRGGDFAITYTDWRANTVVDSFGIDREIGQAQGHGRFGTYSYGLQGELEHEVSVGWYFDDGQGWRAEESLRANKKSELLAAGRTAFEKSLTVPSGRVSSRCTST